MGRHDTQGTRVNCSSCSGDGVDRSTGQACGACNGTGWRWER